MDKRTIIGLVIIAALFVGYMLITKPGREAKERAERTAIREQQIKDSVENVQKALFDATKKEIQDTVSTSTFINLDSVNNVQTNKQKSEKYGIFTNSFDTTENIYSVENNKMIIKFTNKGGKIYSVVLKEYKTFDSLPCELFVNNENTVFGIVFDANRQAISTNDLFFTPSTYNSETTISDTLVFSMKLIVNENKYLEYQYIIPPDDYMIKYNINFVGLKNELANNPYISMNWYSDIPGLEKGREWESNNTTIFLRMSNGDVENLGERKNEDSFTSGGSMQWIAYKQQFFSSILIANTTLNSPIINLKKYTNENSPYLKHFETNFDFTIEHSDKDSKQFSYYFGPNKFSVLKTYTDANDKELDLKKIVPLGWGIFGWVNRFLIIPIFNWLGGFISSYGLIIFLLTLIIKIILFPFTYKSYMSTAKMKVLKPQVDAITQKYGPEKKLEAQQETMKLYKNAGASPMGGCLPMLLQFPILIAMFRFFPASIELRQQPFLWADDLSTYDSIFEWTTNIPLISSFYGNHISLFCLLMAASMVFSTLLTQTQQPTNQSMPGMKLMMYLMPVMMLFWFNNYSSGLSYYYLLANIITILQTLIIRKFFVDEKKILAQMEANKHKAKTKTKTKFQQRMDELMKAQQQQRK